MPSLVLQRLALTAAGPALAALLACGHDPAATEPGDAAVAVQGIRFLRVSAGEAHTCAIATGGQALCWGSNSSGQLGTGTDLGPESCDGSACSTRPVPVASALTFRQLSAEGRFHTCGIATDDRAYCWGGNHLGQLGTGTGTPSFVPIPVAGGLRWREVSAGTNHTCGVTLDDVAYCWGHNQAGRLGNGTENGSRLPVKVARRLAWRGTGAGEQFSCGVTTGLLAFCWGENTSGQLGIGDATGPESCFTGDNSVPCSATPLRVVRGLSFDHVAVRFSHACGITTEGVAYCWGSSGAGNLGNRTFTGPEECSADLLPCSTRPVRVAGRLNFRLIRTGDSHTCAITAGGLAYCWGFNDAGQLGAGFATGPERCAGVKCSTIPLAVLGNLSFTDLEAGSRHTCGVTTGNALFCWGHNGAGQLGDGTMDRRVRPRRVIAGG